MDLLDRPKVRDDGLQLDEHRSFQERFWRSERIAWIFFVVIVGVALLGGFGSGGPLAMDTTDAAAAIIEHPRIGRWEGTDEMTITFKPDPTRPEQSLHLSNSFAETFQVEDIQPLPLRTLIADGGQTLYFANPDRTSGTVTLHLRAQSAGFASFDIAINEGEPQSLTSFIFP